MEYKIINKMKSLGNEIREMNQELLELAEDSGKASVLAFMSAAIDDDSVSRTTIRRWIDEAVGELSLDAIELYCEMKAENAKENKK